MLLAQVSPKALDTILPRPSVSTAEWAQRNVILPRGSEIRGKLRLDLFPHARDVFEAFDDPTVRTITLQWASRLGKTVTAQACLAKVAAVDPHPMAFADADERSTRRVLKRLWRILERVPSLREQLPAKHMRASDHINLIDSIIHGAWSGSPMTAADYAAFVVVLNEIDKMTRRESDEADFAYLMEERAKGFRRHKILRMSTPTLKGQSRVESFRLAGDNRGRFVPCPHCQQFQVLEFGDKDTPGGLKWQHKADGHSDQHLASETAYYECKHCRGRILDQHRYEILNAAVWVAEGQSIDGMGRITGRKARPGPDASFGPLSTLYSLLPSITFGMCAKKFLATRRDKEERRNFTNSWQGITWDALPQTVNVHQIAERLGTNDPILVCPAWAVFLTEFIDVAGDADEFEWQVCAWGPFARGHVIDYGLLIGEDQLQEHIAQRDYQHADGGTPLRISRTLIDSGSGFHTEKIYAFCRKNQGCFPSKGMNGFAEFMRVVSVDQMKQPARRRRTRRVVGGLHLYEINHERSQRWIQDAIEGGTKDGPDAFTLASEVALEINGPFLAHFVNELPGDEVYREGNRFQKWIRTGPNEQRDCARGNRALADLLMNHGKNWPKIKRFSQPVAATPARKRPLTTPDGRPFLATER